jgi:hypothetical protein
MTTNTASKYPQATHLYPCGSIDPGIMLATQDFHRVTCAACHARLLREDVQERRVYGGLCRAARAVSLELACALQETSHGNHGLAREHLYNAKQYTLRIVDARLASRASVLCIVAERVVGRQALEPG